MAQFEKGHVGGPGRPKGSRNKIAEDFLTDLSEVWVEYGKAVIETIAKDNPVTFVEIVCGLLPKDTTLNVNQTITHKSEPVSELAGWLESISPIGSNSKNAKPRSH